MTPEHPPLLPGGFQLVDPRHLEPHFLDPFPAPEAKHRKRLLTRLNRYLEELAGLGIPLEVWVGGSFATMNPEPNGVDVVVWATEADVERLQGKRLRGVERLLHPTYREGVTATFGVHARLADPASLTDCDYWLKKFSADPGNVYRKGIFKLTLNRA